MHKAKITEVSTPLLHSGKLRVPVKASKEGSHSAEKGRIWISRESYAVRRKRHIGSRREDGVDSAVGRKEEDADNASSADQRHRA
jgi:hypothetical protein